MMDPLAEKYYSISPYAYCAGDPVNIIDERGDSIILSKTGYIIELRGDDNGVYYINTDGSATKIGVIGERIDINYIYSNLLQESIHSSRKMSPLELRKRVRNHGEWDLKNNKHTIYGISNKTTTTFEFEGMELTPADVGNHHFGAVSESNVFISESFALRQAGAAQKAAGTSCPEWQIKREIPLLVTTPGGIIRLGSLQIDMPPYGDDPIDQEWIKRGFYYAKKK